MFITFAKNIMLQKILKNKQNNLVKELNRSWLVPLLSMVSDPTCCSAHQESSSWLELFKLYFMQRK